MVDEQQSQSAPSAPMMRAPAEPPPAIEPTPVAAKPGRKRGPKPGSGNGASKRRGGRPPVSDAERAARESEQRARAEEQAKQAAARQAHVRTLARAASIGALTPGLLDHDEISALAKFTLSQLQGQPPAEQGQQ